MIGTINEIMSIEDKRLKIASNYETIQVLRSRLEKNHERERFGMTRAAYIKMIFDVTRKVDKQNDELSKAIIDTRFLQRDISNVCGRLERSFKLVEEAILKVSVVYYSDFFEISEYSYNMRLNF